MTRMQARMLPDGKRLHLADGPIDVIIGANGEPAHVARAYEVAQIRFSTILDELCSELPLLRQPTEHLPNGAVARRMWRATLDHAPRHFITPMAAMAGSVVDSAGASVAKRRMASAGEWISTASPFRRISPSSGGWRP